MSGTAGFSMEEPSATRGARACETATLSRLSPEEMASYHRDGFVIKKSLFDADEAKALLAAATSDGVLTEKTYSRGDAKGFETKLCLWTTCGVNIYGALARCARIVDNVESLLSGPSHGSAEQRAEEAYHYHTKVLKKEPRVGGAWEWHQDYGYWYNNSCPFPRMLSVMVALNEHTEENGCLHVLRGSHDLGRVNHQLTGGQIGADEDRVEHARATFEDVSCLLKPGDTLFFHSNTMHASMRNESDGHRWSIISAYNARSNSPFREGPHPSYTPLDRWHDSAVKALATVSIQPGDGTVFFNSSTETFRKRDDEEPPSKQAKTA